MRESVRALVLKDGALLVMQRNKRGQVFYSLVGGGIDDGETAEQALHREVAEEASLVIANPKLLITQMGGQRFGRQYIYYCEYVTGTPALAPDSTEARDTAAGTNVYKPLWLSLNELPHVTFLPPELQHTLVAMLPDNIPSTPISLMTTE